MTEITDLNAIEATARALCIAHWGDIDVWDSKPTVFRDIYRRAVKNTLAFLPIREAIPQRPMRAKEIVAEVAIEYGLTFETLTGPGRCRHLVHARFDAISRLREVKTLSGRPRYSYPVIGRLMNRDHTTILSGHRRWAEIQGSAE